MLCYREYLSEVVCGQRRVGSESLERDNVAMPSESLRRVELCACGDDSSGFLYALEAAARLTTC